MKTNELTVVTKGYGRIANSVMEREDLSLGAKGLYAYFISKSGSSPCCYPSNKTIMKVLSIGSRITLSKYKGELECAKLLTIEERKQKSGRLTSNYYYPAKVKLEKDE